ncbi:FecR domain-containing protein [Marinobacter litoralis]|uniref:FecR domain-containing protein n=1 Tax=Marinobacter litoralis TaxID=187981 RepID=UPI0018EB8A23|nr:FecR domain-containing protein [Marinobacter litoralis]MBJ6136411.1 FecR domain-containing protein [Marinobacter litoralis]
MDILVGPAKSKMYRCILGLSLMMLTLFAMAAEPIRVESFNGQVQYRAHEHEAWKPVQAGLAVEAPVEFRALADASGLISQAGSEFELKSGSHVVLQANTAESDGLVNRIKQWFGTVFYRIERQPDEFSVETPFLVSTVKGTRFVIVTTDTSSLVTLTEGSLEVLDLASEQTQMMSPGDVVGVGDMQAGIQTFQQSEQSVSSASAEPAAGAVAVTESGAEKPASFDVQLQEMVDLGAGSTVESGDTGDEVASETGDLIGQGVEPAGDEGLGLGAEIGLDDRLDLGLDADVDGGLGLDLGVDDVLDLDAGLELDDDRDFGVDDGRDFDQDDFDDPEFDEDDFDDDDFDDDDDDQNQGALIDGLIEPLNPIL